MHANNNTYNNLPKLKIDLYLESDMSIDIFYFPVSYLWGGGLLRFDPLTSKKKSLQCIISF